MKTTLWKFSKHFILWPLTRCIIYFDSTFRAMSNITNYYIVLISINWMKSINYRIYNFSNSFSPTINNHYRNHKDRRAPALSLTPTIIKREKKYLTRPRGKYNNDKNKTKQEGWVFLNVVTTRDRMVSFFIQFSTAPLSLGQGTTQIHHSKSDVAITSRYYR